LKNKIVGYKKDELLNMAQYLDGIVGVVNFSKSQIRNSFLKICLSDLDTIRIYKKEIFSIILSLRILEASRRENAYKYNTEKAITKIIIPNFNRALYQQGAIPPLDGIKDKISIFQHLAVEQVVSDHIEKGLVYIMRLDGDDLGDLIIDKKKLSYYLLHSGILNSSFFSIQEIINAEERYNYFD